jgi:hypothetical protein
VTLLRLWTIATSVLVAGLAVWAFAPVLVFIVLLALALGLLSAAMIGLARGLQTWRQRRDPTPPAR